MRKCPCGSGRDAWWVHDAQNIPLAKVCVDCKDAKLRRFKPEVLSGYNQSDMDEPIEPDEW